MTIPYNYPPFKTDANGNILVSISGGLTNTLTNTHIFVGNASNVATDVAVSGDATLANTGALTITSIGGAGAIQAKGYSPVNAQVGTTFAPALADNGTCVTLSNGSAITVTIPANGSVAFPVGASIDFASLNTGIVTFAITSDTLVSKGAKVTLTGQYSVGNIKKVASTTWLLSGDLA